MKYEFAEDLQAIAEEVSKMMFSHIDISRVKCFRSYGSSSPRTIARTHALGKLMQKAMNVGAFYSIEFISEKFDKMSKKEQLKTIIHELMHIPKTFGGGFRHHDWVCEENVDLHYQTYVEKKRQYEKNKYWFQV